MKKFFIPLALLLFIIAGCRHNDPNLVEAKLYTLSDSIYLENEFEDGYSHFTINLELPVTDNDSLRINILHWMLSEKTEDFQSCLERAKIQFFEGEGSEPSSNYEGNYTLVEQTDRYVTYITEGFLYSGGAHDMPWYYGATFSKIDGSIVGYDLFDNPEGLVNLIAENITKQYFDQLEEDDFLFDYTDITELPVNDPWIETDSVVFCFQPYEIAAYATGIPLCKISKEALLPYLSEKGKSILF